MKTTCPANFSRAVTTTQRAPRAIASFWANGLGALFLLCWVFGLSLLAPMRGEAAFGLTNSGGYYTVDTGAGLVFKVNQANGDITSLKYNGTEYQEPTKGSHINSGLGTSTVTGVLWGSQTIKIEVVAGTLTHYYMARKNQNNIYMGTYFTEEPTIGLVRYIVRIPSAKLTNGPVTSDIRNNTGAVEASDVFGYANGQTRSKHYSAHRLMDFSYTGATGTNVGVFMVRSNHEGGSGGPFYRTIDNQCGDDQEIYEIVNYGEGQTEPFRFGVFNGPYILTFTDGSAPTTPIDTSWIHSTGIDATLQGWVQDRGIVTGQATGIPAGFQGVVGFANTTAQYWCVVNNGTFTSPAMIPGTYTMTLYKGELAVATQSVTATANVTTTQNIASTEILPYARWRIGEWDGTPAGFLNADKVTSMHPSDVRMSPWGPVTYTIGTSTPNSFPAYQWKDVNNPTTIQFNLTQAELTSHTLRVGLTCAYSGARPRVTVNSWTSSIPSPSTQPDSRTLTVGTYRGNNTTYTYNIPASAFVAGTNTLTLTVVSGSGTTGFLSAGYSYDCVELDAPWTGTFRLTPQHAQDKALGILNSNPNNSAQTVISSYQPSTSQQFLLDLQTDGTYRIRTALTGNRCVELPFGDPTNGNLIKLWDDNSNSAQRWNIVPVVGEWVKIVPKNDATKCMDVTGGPSATANGTTVESWTYSGGSNQLWRLNPIVVAATKATPSVQNDSYSINEDGTLSVPVANGLLANDTGTGTLAVADANTNLAGIQPLSGPLHGTLTLNVDGSFSYTPAANFNGSDSFTYQTTDGTLISDVATVTLTINAVNDAPIAAAQTVSTPQDTALGITLTATDVENNALTYSIATGPIHGTLSGTAPNVTYTPTSGYFGPDSFTFKASDGAADSAPATVALTVTPANTAPIAEGQTVSTPQNTSLPLTLTATDAENDALTYSIVIGPTHGTLSGTAPNVTYTPTGGYIGNDSFTFKANDGKVDSAPATIAITVVHVNAAPTATVILAPASPMTTTVLQATATGSDADGDTVSLAYVWKKNDVVIEGAIGSTLDLGVGGNGDKGDVISVAVTPGDGQVSGEPATASTTILNSPPVLAATTFNGRENTPLVGQGLIGQDADGEELTYSVTKTTLYGTLKLESDGTFNYTSKPNWNGTDKFTVSAKDGSGATNTATITLVIAPVNGLPIAVNDVVKGTEDVPMTIAAATLLRNDLNGENKGEVDALKIIKVAAPSSFPGKLALDLTKQTILFTPALNWNGTTSFSYTLQDSGKATATAQVKVQLGPVNDAPIALGGRMTVVSGMAGELPMLGRDVEGAAITFALKTKPAHGVAQVVRVGTKWFLHYQSTVGFIGTDTLTVVALEGRLTSLPAKVTITVKPNNAPQLLGVTPNKGRFPAGSTIVFQQQVRDAQGTQQLDATALLLSNTATSTDARNGATLWFDAITNRFTITKNDGKSTFIPVALGQTLENSQVRVTLGSADVTRTNNVLLTLKWHVTFKPTFVGTKSLWARAEDQGGLSAGFTKIGDITLVPASAAPSAPSS
ncbi:hypothetical protein IAD21_04564 [Abditibacteriota bacterium]|nr:hypothetical protein IAD21_04564 [Abditibacteriota bacterium]